MKSKKISRYLSIVFAIRSAQFARKAYLTHKFHKDYVPILNILVRNGFVRTFDIKDGGKLLLIWLKGTRNVIGIWQPAFVELSRLPHYDRNPISISYRRLLRHSRHDGGSSLYIINTDRGLITHLDALRFNIGGKVLFRIV